MRRLWRTRVGSARLIAAVAAGLWIAFIAHAPANAAAVDAAKKPPMWAVQLTWTEGGNDSLNIMYNSHVDTLKGAYVPTVGIMPQITGSWQTHTWKLTDVDFAGRENGETDLRLNGSPGVAVHEVAFSLQPVAADHGDTSPSSPTASVVFGAGAAGANIDQGAEQGPKSDGIYTSGIVAGKSAETFGTPGYIYLKLKRDSQLFMAHPTVVYVTVTYTLAQPLAVWSQQAFTKLASSGIHDGLLLTSWAAIEPEPGHFNFQVLDQTLANAAKVHFHIIPIFIFSGWPGDPAPWITDQELGSDGRAAPDLPRWWNPSNHDGYFTYLSKTLAHVKNSPAFDGAFLNYGWLDGIWGGPGSGEANINGYAPEDVARFHQWLPTRYNSLDAFNKLYHVSYVSWDAVPADGPSQPLFSVYQQFRNWSVFETVTDMMALARRQTQKTLYYYWGGACAQGGITFNMPDTFFQIAQRYRVTLCLDDANGTGQALLFGSLASAYGVPVLQEWTPPRSGMQEAMAQFLGHYALNEPQQAGMDFFIYTPEGWPPFAVTWPMYVKWLPILSQIDGVYPEQPVALYISFASAFSRPLAPVAVGPRSFVETVLSRIWTKLHVPFTVVTDREIAAGAVRLNQFRAVVSLTGQDDPALVAYAAQGGHVYDQAHCAELLTYAKPYISFTPDAGNTVEAAPTVNRAKRTAWLTFSGCVPAHPYTGTTTIDLNALGLEQGQYHIIDAATGLPVASMATPGGLQVSLSVAPGQLTVWHILPGSGEALPRSPLTN